MFTVPSYASANGNSILKDYTTPTVTIGNITTLASGVRTNSTLTVPSGVVNGDLMFATYMSTLAITPTLASWTLLAGYTDTKLFNIYYRVANSEPASYTITHSSGTTVVGCINLKPEAGHSFNTPTISAQLNLNNTLCTCPSVSGLANSILLNFICGQASSGTIEPAPGMTEQWDLAYSTTGRSFLMTQILTRTKATGTRLAVISGSQNNRCASVLVTQT